MGETISQTHGPVVAAEPHSHVLRPRVSFYRSAGIGLKVASGGSDAASSLRSPLKLADLKNNNNGSSRMALDDRPTSSRTRAAGSVQPTKGALLFPSSPEDQENRAVVNQPKDGAVSRTSSTASSIRRMTSSGGLRKLATSLSGAFSNAKGKGATGKKPKPGFDLSDWNYDLAAIASHPSSSASSPLVSPAILLPPAARYPSLSVLPAPGAFCPQDGLVTPTTASFTAVSALHRAMDHGIVLEVPAETRRRKSDEMEEGDRDDFHSPAQAVRRDIGRPHSLAHAHTLRSSRTLSDNSIHAASLAGSPSMSTSLSNSYALQGRQSPSFGSPFGTKSRLPAPQHYDDTLDRDHPPAKKVSVQEDYSDDDEEDTIFGGSALASTKNSMRAKSFSRLNHSRPGSIISIPASSSHPGWQGDGFDTAIKPKHITSHGVSRPRMRSNGNSSTNLDTLAESGPPIDYFSVPVRGGGIADFSLVLGSGEETSRRNSSESTGGFNLLGSRVATTAAATLARQSKSDLVACGPGSGEGSAVSGSAVAGPSSLSLDSFPSRRAASLDSLFLISHLPPGSPYQGSPVKHNLRANVATGVGGRKRNANGALLVGAGSGHGSRLAAVSPTVGAASSPAPWNVRETRGEMYQEEEEEEDAMDEDARGLNGWGGNLSPPPPSLTDGTTSASSSLSTSLSSHGDGDQSGDLNHGVHDSLKLRNNSLPTSLSGGTFYTPQQQKYQNVRPLQAAFLSSGLVSKRSRGRNDSGVGLGTTPLYRPQPSLSDSTNSNISNPDSRSAVPLVQSSLPISTSRATLMMMPDTPVKRAAFGHPSTASARSIRPVPETSVLDTFAAPPAPPGVPPPATSVPLRRDSISPVGTIMVGRSYTKLTAAGSPSPCSNSSGSKSDLEDISPTSRALRSSSRAAESGACEDLGELAGNMRHQLFRRRSSGQLASVNEPGNILRMRVGRSGSSSNSSSSGKSGMIRESEPESEPMTPTRSVSSRWSENIQLVGTPTGGPSTPSTLGFSVPYALPQLSTTFEDPPVATPHLRKSYPFSTFGDVAHTRPFDLEKQRLKNRLSGPDPATLLLQTGITGGNNSFELNYTILRSLGNGEFSDAFEVLDKQRNGVYAVKRTKHAFGGNKDRARRREEVDILRLLSSDEQRSPHLIQFVDGWEQNGHLFIQTELCESGNLAYFLEEYGRLHEVLDETRVWKILTEISEGVDFMHQRDVIHLDLKPANVFITERGHLKIGDFGLATCWPRPLSIARGSINHAPEESDPSEETATPASIRNGEGAGAGERRVRAKSNGDSPEDLEREGDREYIAPEIMGGRYGKAADVFSVGLIILEAAANVVLPDNGPAWHKLRSNDFSDVDLSRLSQELQVVLAAMLEKAPDDRSSIESVLAHPVTSRLAHMLELSMDAEESAPSSQQTFRQQRLVLGAILPEEEGFLYDLFSSVYNYAGDDSFSGAGDVSVGGDGDDELEDSMEIDG